MPLSPALLLAAAHAFVGLGEEHPGGQRGRLVHCLLSEMGLVDGAGADVPWHTALAHHLGYWSHFDQRSLRSSWPLPVSADVQALATFAEQEGVLAEHPVEGDLFLLWGPAKRAFVRTGIVVRVEQSRESLNGRVVHECITIEGDTDPSRAARGGQTLRQLRTLSAARGDRFVRWTALEPGEQVARRVDAAQIRKAPAKDGAGNDMAGEFVRWAA